MEYVDRLRKRQGHSLRFLPLHLALEGLLALHFGPPSIKWPELSREFHRLGLGHRWERGVLGRHLSGFEESLRTFELHRGQVGMLVFVADELASAFVVPSATDYAQLHHSLLDDLYGELVCHYAALYPDTPPLDIPLELQQVKSFADIRAGLAKLRHNWAEYTQNVMLNDLLGQPLITEKVYQPHQLALERFIGSLEEGKINHIGERLTRANGELMYLKTFQLSVAQTCRAALLHQLASYDWHLENAAKEMQLSVPQLVKRLEKAGFGYLLTQAVREQAAKAMRHDGRY